MVKKIFFLLSFLITSVSWCQTLSLGLGSTAKTSAAAFRSSFNFDVLTVDGDTLKLEADDVNINKSISFPIYARYSSKKKWWIQLNYGFETWRLGTIGTATATNYAIDRNVNQRLIDSYAQYSGSLDSASFREEFYEIYQQDEEAASEVSFEGYERVQYNKLSFSFGSVLNQKGLIKFYYGLGFDLMTISTFESYQGLVFNSDRVSFQNEVLDAFPKLKSAQFATFINFGLERQNLRIGAELSYSGNAAVGGHKSSFNNVTQSNEINENIVRSITSFGVSLNYSLFSHNFNQRISEDKKAVLDPTIIGRHYVKPKLFQFGVGVDLPSLHNSGWSVLEDYNLEDINDELNDQLRAKNDAYITGLRVDEEDLFDFVYIEKQDADPYINEQGEIDTNILYTTLFFNSGNINTVLKSPKIFGFVRINPFENWSFDYKLGFQNQTYGIEVYETQNGIKGEESSTRTRRLLYQENFNEVQLGINTYYHTKLNNVSRIGVSVGINYCLWAPGKFIVEPGGVNDGELIEDFHDYIIENDDAEEWNRNENPDGDKGLFSKEDYYNHTYEPESEAAQRESYHSDFSDYQLDTPLKRSFMELRVGVDYYLENLKFSIYAERSVWKKKFLYNDMLSVGMGVSLFF